MSQAVAVQKVHAWFTSKLLSSNDGNTNLVTDSVFAMSGSSEQHLDCKSEKSTVVHVVRLSTGIILKASVHLLETDGEHEVLTTQTPIRPQTIITHSPELSGYVKYSLNPKEHDRFELFLPEKIQIVAGKGISFKSFLKYSFDDNYPTLEPMQCHSDNQF